MSDFLNGELLDNCSTATPRRNGFMAAGLLLLAALALGVPLAMSPMHWQDTALFAPAEPGALAARPADISATWFPEPPHVAPPLSRALIGVQKSLWGAGGQRALACLFHAASALLLWFLLRRLRRPGAYLAALLFVVHPLAVDALGWVFRLDVVFGLPFALLSLLAWAQFLRSPPRRWLWYLLMLVSLTVSALSCPLALTVPLLAAFLVWWRRSDPARRAPGHAHSPAGTPPAAPGVSAPSPGPSPGPNPTPPAASPPAGGGRRHHHRRRWWHRLGNVLVALVGMIKMPNDWAAKNLIRLVPALFIAGSLVPAHIHWARQGLTEVATFALFDDPMPALATWGWCWLEGLRRVLVPLAQPLLQPFHGGSMAVADGHVPIFVLASLLVLLYALRALPGARGLLLAALASMLTIAPAVLVTPPHKATDFFTAGAAYYWQLPAVAALVAAAVGTVARSAGVAGAVARAAGFALFVACALGAGWRTAQFAAPALPWERLAQRYPTPWILTEAGATRLQQGDLDAACALFEQALTAGPTYAPALDGLGQVLYRQSRDYVAQSRFDQAIEQNPNDPNLRLRLALACEAWGLQRRALESYADVVRLRPDSRFALRQQGLALIRASQTVRAMQPFERLIELDPADTGARLYLGILQALQGNQETARSLAAQALRQRPGDPAARLLLGYTYYQQRQETEARREFEGLRRDHPERVATEVFLFFLCLDNARYEEAATHCLAALRARPNHPQLLAVVSQILANYPQFKLTGDGLDTVSLAEKACRLTGYAEPSLLETLALAYAEVGRTRDALQLLDKASAFAEGRNQVAMVAQLRSIRGQVAAGTPLPDRDTIILSVPDVVELLLL